MRDEIQTVRSDEIHAMRDEIQTVRSDDRERRNTT